MKSHTLMGIYSLGSCGCYRVYTGPIVVMVTSWPYGNIVGGFNSLLPNDAIWCHDLYELSISLWEFIWGF